jgi:hypothetical protein
MNDPTYNMDDEEVEETHHKPAPKPTESESDAERTTSSSPQPGEISEYLQPVALHEDVAHIPDEPSGSETESEPEDLAGLLSDDDDWTEVAAVTAGIAVSEISSAISSKAHVSRICMRCTIAEIVVESATATASCAGARTRAGECPGTLVEQDAGTFC